ncbi:MAG: hypothetical protein WBH50_07920, partial [Fuerstiella sp.]
MTTSAIDVWSPLTSVWSHDETPFGRTAIVKYANGTSLLMHEVEWSSDVPAIVQTRLKHETLQFAKVRNERIRVPIDVEFGATKGRIVCPYIPLARLAEQ